MKKTAAQIREEQAKLAAELAEAEKTEVELNAYLAQIDSCIIALRTIGYEYQYGPVKSATSKGSAKPKLYKFGNFAWAGIGNLPKAAPADLKQKWEAAKGDKAKRMELLTPYKIAA